MKFRIVSRRKHNKVFYFAQVKCFNVFWIDCPNFSGSAIGEWKGGLETPSLTLKLVENYVEYMISNENCKDKNQTVIKTYD